MLLYVDDSVLMSETIVGLRNKLLRWKEVFESKSLKVSLGRSNVTVSGGIITDGLCKSKVDPCEVCSLRLKTNSVLFLDPQLMCWSEKDDSKVLKKYYMQKLF